MAAGTSSGLRGNVLRLLLRAAEGQFIRRRINSPSCSFVLLAWWTKEAPAPKLQQSLRILGDVLEQSRVQERVRPRIVGGPSASRGPHERADAPTPPLYSFSLFGSRRSHSSSPAGARSLSITPT